MIIILLFGIFNLILIKGQSNEKLIKLYLLTGINCISLYLGYIIGKFISLVIY